jgi:hypothetical protein
VTSAAELWKNKERRTKKAKKSKAKIKCLLI